MTARQPPREKGAKACTIGLYQSRDWYFCTYFLGEQKNEVQRVMLMGGISVVCSIVAIVLAFIK